MAVVHVPPGEATPVARDLLAAAQELGLPPQVVRTASDGLFGFSFIVPDEVYDRMLRAQEEVSEPASGWGADEPEEDGEEEPQEPEAPVKRKPGRPRKTTAPQAPEEK